MNPAIRILPLPSANGFLGGRMNQKLANDMKMWKRNLNTTTLLYSLKELETLHRERRGQVNIGIEHVNSILFHKSTNLLSGRIPTNKSIYELGPPPWRVTDSQVAVPCSIPAEWIGANPAS